MERKKLLWWFFWPKMAKKPPQTRADEEDGELLGKQELSEAILELSDELSKPSYLIGFYAFGILMSSYVL